MIAEKKVVAGRLPLRAYYGSVVRGGVPYRYLGHATMRTRTANGVAPRIDAGRPEFLLQARYARPSRVGLLFEDGFAAVLDIALLEMPEEKFDWTTCAASPTGAEMTVVAKTGHVIPIGAATLRCFVDPVYAAVVKARNRELRLTREELRQLAKDSPPPPEWFAEPSRDLTHPAWK